MYRMLVELWFFITFNLHKYGWGTWTRYRTNRFLRYGMVSKRSPFCWRCNKLRVISSCRCTLSPPSAAGTGLNLNFSSLQELFGGTRKVIWRRSILLKSKKISNLWHTLSAIGAFDPFNDFRPSLGACRIVGNLTAVFTTTSHQKRLVDAISRRFSCALHEQSYWDCITDSGPGLIIVASIRRGKRGLDACGKGFSCNFTTWA